MLAILVFFVVGKNAFAMAVLRRIEMKIDGQDIDESRYCLFCIFIDAFKRKLSFPLAFLFCFESLSLFPDKLVFQSKLIIC